MSLISFLNGVFKSKNEENLFFSCIEKLCVGGSFSLDACHIYDISGKSFNVKKSWIYLSNDSSVEFPFFDIEESSSGDCYSVCAINIFGKKKYHFCKELSSGVIEELFFDKNWVFIDDEDKYIPPSDFRFIFDDNCRSDFVLKRYGLPKINGIDLTDWVSDSYRFFNGVFTQMSRDTTPSSLLRKDSFQQYILIDDKTQNTICINVDSNGATRVFAGYLADPFLFKNITNSQ